MRDMRLHPSLLQKSCTPMKDNPTLPFFSGKNRWFFLVMILAAVAVVIGLLARRQASPYHALPSQAAVVLEYDGWHRVLQLQKNISDPAWAKILETSAFRNAGQDAAMAGKLLEHDPDLKKALAGNKLLAALTLNRADSLHGLFVLETGRETDLGKLLDTNPLSRKIFPSLFHDHTLYTVHLGKRDRLVLASAGKLLLFSRFSYLVEDAITQLEGASSWWADRKWMHDPQQDGPLRVFFRPAAMAAQYGNSVAEAWSDLPALLERNVEWVGLSWNGKDLAAHAEVRGFLGTMSGWGEAPAGDIQTVLPDNTALMARAAFDSPRRFFERIKRAESADFEQYVLPWAGHEAAWVVTEPFSAAMRDDQYVVLAARDSAAALASLRDYASRRGALRVGDYQTFEVFEFMSQSLLAPLVGESRNFRTPCCAITGRYVIFANTRSALELWIDKFIVNQTLANNTDFLQLQQKKPAAGGNLQVLLNTAYLPLLLKNLFDAGRISFHPPDVQALSAAGFIGLQARAAGDDRLELQLAAQTQAAAATETSILWKTPLAGLAATPPVIVGPAAENNDLAIVIQDVRHELYRLNAGGEVVWRRQMEGAVLGAVQGIDFWGNGTLFFLFNTADRIWLLNDEGRDVEGFPLVLQSPATNGVVAVDFDKSLKYNYFVACANGNLYGYDQFGRALPGWNPQGGVGRIVHPVVHFQHANKDYIVALNESGRLFAFGRNGAERFPAVQFSGKNFGPLQVDAAARAPRIVCANGAGTVFVCNLAGETFDLSLGKSGPAAAHLVFAPLSGDARFDYAVAKENEILAKGYEGNALKTLFKAQFPLRQDTLFAAPEKRLGSLNRSKRQIWLLDGRGDVHPGFPLAGTTPFIISDLFQKNGGQVLVVGDGSSVYAYKIR